MKFYFKGKILLKKPEDDEEKNLKLDPEKIKRDLFGSNDRNLDFSSFLHLLYIF